MQKIITFATILFSITLFVSSCAKKTGCKDPLALNFDPEVEVANGTCTYPTLSLDISYKMGNLPFEINRIYTVDSSIIAFRTLQFYLSEFSLSKADNSLHTFEDSYILGNGLPSFKDSLGEIFVEDYSEFSCLLGVDEATNNQLNANLSSKSSSHPLGVKSPAMHWTNPAEYIFLQIKGKVDVNGDGIPSDNEDFVYEIGTNALLQSLSFPINKTFRDAQNTIALEIDVEQLVKGVDIKSERFTHSTDDFALASKIANNIVDAVKLK
ncbi:MAG: hypothetical protein GY810_18430 [Aureispira sp.]|nr:hypothetical protein [Aureispira sp.]